MDYSLSPKSIKYHIKQYLNRHQDRFKGKSIVDFPAGSGTSSKVLQEIGANPIPFDLFPEYFKVKGITCIRANINTGIPLEDGSVDGILCQEGIEHFTDQALMFKEFGRIIKKGGSLIITTPNYSSLKAKLSYLLTESERFHSIISPNELDSIWMNRQDITNEFYYGHIFLTGIQKMRVLAKLNGFQIKYIQKTRFRNTNLILFPFLYPLIHLSNWITYRKALKKNKRYPMEVKKEVYKEIRWLNTHMTILLDGHLFIEFEKTSESSEVVKNISSMHQEFGDT